MAQCLIGALIINWNRVLGLNNWNGVPFKRILQGLCKGSIVGFYSIGALKIRIGFWGPLYYNYK